MTKQFHFLAGLPRSGCTLLSNVLAQNPRLHASAQGGILGAMITVRNDWNRMVVFRAAPNEAGKRRVLRAMFESYYDDSEKPVVIDRSLGWLGSLELAEEIIGRRPKVIVCVRDVRDVLASFEIQWRTVPAMQEFVKNHPTAAQWQTLEGRCGLWAGGEEPVGIAYNQIKDAQARGFREQMHFVRFEDLMRTPDETLRGIYEFLEEPFFSHDFTRVEQVVWETHALYGVPEMNWIPSQLAPVPPLWPEMLGAVAHKYDDACCW